MGSERDVDPFNFISTAMDKLSRYRVTRPTAAIENRSDANYPLNSREYNGFIPLSLATNGMIPQRPFS